VASRAAEPAGVPSDCQLKRRLLGATVTATVLSAFSQAWASWKTAPGVALLAIVAFAVGIGSAMAIFTVVSGVLLRPLPYPSSERFVSLSGARTTEPGILRALSVPELHDYEQQTTSFDAFGWFRGGAST
jgi:putative ABC transport system permease protein